MVKRGGSAVKASPGNDAKRAKLADGEELELAEGVKVLAERGGEFVEAEVVKESKKAGFWACRFDDGKLLPKSPAMMKSPFKKRPADDDEDDASDDASDEAGGDDAGDDASDGDDDDEEEVTVAQPTAEQLVSGADVFALRDGEYEPATVQGPSKKKEGQFALKFEDGKLLTKPLDEIKISADPNAAADEDDAADDDNMDDAADAADADGDDASDSDEGVDAVDATEADMVKGASVFAERNGEFEPATVNGPSKKPGKFAVKFESDGKVLPKSLEDIKILAEAAEGGGDDDASDDASDDAAGADADEKMDDADDADGSDDEEEVQVVEPTADQLTEGAEVFGERGDGYEPAVVQGPSKKKPNHWALKFDSDGKVLPKPLDQIKINAPAGGADAAGDAAADDSDDADDAMDSDEAGGELTADMMENGLTVLAKRGEEFLPAVVQNESKKKAGHWAVKFEDGKVFPKALSDLKAMEGGDDEAAEASAEDEAGDASGDDEAAAASGDDSDDDEVSVVQPTAEQLVKGADVFGMRNGEYEPATVNGPSKKAGFFALKFESDGKVLPKALDDIKMHAAAAGDAGDDDVAGDDDADDAGDASDDDADAADGSDDEDEVDAVDATEADMVKGASVFAERNGEFEPATVNGPSKKPGKFALKFESDGKVLPKALSDIKVVAEAGGDDDEEEKPEVDEDGSEDGSGDEEEVDVSDATPADLVKGASVYAKRGDDFEEATVQFPSKKKENHWAVKFESDGKVLPKPLDQIKIKGGAAASDDDSEEETARPTPVKTGGKADDEKTVFVGNLSFAVEKETLQEHFADCGNVQEVRIATDRDTGKPRGFAHISFDSTSAVEKALKMAGTEVDGREIRVDTAGGSSPGGKGKGGKGKGKGGKGKGKGGKGKGKGKGKGGKGKGKGKGGKGKGDRY
jgi:nucleolin